MPCEKSEWPTVIRNCEEQKPRDRPLVGRRDDDPNGAVQREGVTLGRAHHATGRVSTERRTDGCCGNDRGGAGEETRDLVAGNPVEKRIMPARKAHLLIGQVYVPRNLRLAWKRVMKSRPATRTSHSPVAQSSHLPHTTSQMAAAERTSRQWVTAPFARPVCRRRPVSG